MSTLEKLSPGYHAKPDACPDCGSDSSATILIGGSTAPQEWTRHRCKSCCDKTERTFADARRRDELENQARLALSLLGVPPLYCDSTLDNLSLTGDVENRAKQTRSLQLARRFLAEWPNVPMITVLVGVPGSGKGHVVWSLARALAAVGVQPRVSVLSDAIRDLREAWGSNEGGMSEVQRLHKYRSADLLVIDEVSRHAFYGQPQQHLYDLVAWREIRLKPTILTTNETGAALAEFLGPALSSRALGWGRPWDMGLVDYRLEHGVRRSS